ncbi:hypothetical protein N9B68_01050, partial [bacterium]|nr:hypothetical protein [bacterium]
HVGILHHATGKLFRKGNRLAIAFQHGTVIIQSPEAGRIHRVQFIRRNNLIRSVNAMLRLSVNQDHAFGLQRLRHYTERHNGCITNLLILPGSANSILK